MLYQYCWLSWGDYQQKGASMRNTIRFDSYGNRLYKGEYQYKNHYKYTWADELGNTHIFYAKTIEVLRSFENEITKRNLRRLLGNCDNYP